MTEGADERRWEEGWDGHEQAQLERMAALPLPEKIAWLEEAQRLVIHLTGTAAASEEDRIGGEDEIRERER
jgi:hypothetical protein